MQSITTESYAAGLNKEGQEHQNASGGESEEETSPAVTCDLDDQLQNPQIGTSTLTDSPETEHKSFRTRRIQVRMPCRDLGVQYQPSTVSIGIQCDLLKPQPSEDENMDVSDLELEDCDTDSIGMDPDYNLSSSDDGSDLDSDEDEWDSSQYNLKSDVDPKDERHYLVSESSLVSALSSCRQCQGICHATVANIVGTMVVINQICENGHTYTWRSQQCHKRMPWSNLLTASAIMFSGSSPSNIINMFANLNMPFISLRTYYKIQSYYLIPTVDKCWTSYQEEFRSSLSGKTLSLGGDARCDSPGHCAKYGTYTLMDLHRKLILDVQLVQV